MVGTGPEGHYKWPHMGCPSWDKYFTRVWTDLCDRKCSHAHRCKKKNYKPLCSANVIVFYLAYLALAGLMNLLAQLSDRIIHFSEYNLMPLAFLTKLSIMH